VRLIRTERPDVVVSRHARASPSGSRAPETRRGSSLPVMRRAHRRVSSRPPSHCC
jgi:hypothetical protein